MLTKYSDVMKTPYYCDPFDFDPFKVFDSLYTSNRANSRSRSYRVDETDEGLILSVDLPGVKSKDLSVQVTGREVKVEGKVRGEDFKHVYRVAKSYNPETVSATLEDGVLTLSFAKAEDAKTKTIDVKVK